MAAAREIIDPVFGRLRWSSGCWKGTVNIRALGGAVPVEVDLGNTSSVESPSDKQRACFQDFVNRCDATLTRRIERTIFDYVKKQYFSTIFDYQKEVVDKIETSADVWQTISDLCIFVFVEDRSPRCLALQWCADWEDEHGLQVLYQQGGELRATIQGDDEFDE